MSTTHAIQTVFEIFMVGFLFWGIFNEDKFDKFEKKLFKNIKRKFNSKKEK